MHGFPLMSNSNYKPILHGVSVISHIISFLFHHLLLQNRCPRPYIDVLNLHASTRNAV